MGKTDSLKKDLQTVQRFHTLFQEYVASREWVGDFINEWSVRPEMEGRERELRTELNLLAPAASAAAAGVGSFLVIQPALASGLPPERVDVFTGWQVPFNSRGFYSFSVHDADSVITQTIGRLAGAIERSERV